MDLRAGEGLPVMSVSTVTTTATTESGGCGCGGAAGSGGGSGCGCSGGGSGGIGGAFVRPQFFAGMLLGEDDLRAIDEYAVGKRRLTNRYLFGPGVVCGLDVTCAPCDRRSLAVAPGYALDCCGNDIVSECAQKVDVVALLRDLRRRCGPDCHDDPCADGPRQDYWLVVRYTEQPTDPVAPYQQDDCTVGDCEFSRLREGFAFELSCRRPGTPPSLIDRLQECAKRKPDSDPAVAAATRAITLATLRSRIAQRVAANRTPTVDQPRKPDFDRVETGTLVPGDAVELVTRSTLMLAADAGGAPGRLTDAARALLSDRGPALARRVLGSDVLQELPADQRDRAARILQVAQEVAPGDLTLTDRWWLSEGWTADAAARGFLAAAEQARAEVRRALATSGRPGCAGDRAAAELDLDQLGDRSLEQATALGRSVLRTLGQCLCDEANPPCPSCTDPRVPLAAVRIDGCDVVSVCELDRDFVLSPRVLGYWLPIVDAVRKVLQARCCGSDDRDGGRTELQVLLAMLGQLVQAPAERPEFATLVSALSAADAAGPGGAGGPLSGAAPVPPAPPPVPPPPPAPAAADARVQVLEAQVAALTSRIDALVAAGGGAP
jgi:hypothetical protein